MKNKGTRTAVIHMVNGTVVDAIVTGSSKEVALMLGISQSYISRLEKKIINKLKKELKNVL